LGVVSLLKKTGQLNLTRPVYTLENDMIIAVLILPTKLSGGLATSAIANQLYGRSGSSESLVFSKIENILIKRHRNPIFFRGWVILFQIGIQFNRRDCDADSGFQ
jgi:hypothetical protein